MIFAAPHINRLHAQLHELEVLHRTERQREAAEPAWAVGAGDDDVGRASLCR